MKWVKDQKVEAAFRRLGLPFEIERVERSKIDFEEGVRRQARLKLVSGKLRQDYVLDMSVAMEQPDAAFPMPILYKPPRGLLWPVSGNHRLAAWDLAKPEETSIECYTTNTTDVMWIDMLPKWINSLESGLGFDRDERLANAIYMHQHHGIAAPQAAAFFGLGEKDLYNALRAELVKGEIQQAGLPVNGFSKTILMRLAPLIDNRNVFKSTASFLHRHEMKGDEAVQVISDVRDGKTENQQLGELGRWEKLIEDRERAAKERKKR